MSLFQDKKLSSETDAQPRDASISSRRYRVRRICFLDLVRGHPSSPKRSFKLQFGGRLGCALSALQRDPDPKRWSHSRELPSEEQEERDPLHPPAARSEALLSYPSPALLALTLGFRPPFPACTTPDEASPALSARSQSLSRSPLRGTWRQNGCPRETGGASESGGARPGGRRQEPMG